MRQPAHEEQFKRADVRVLPCSYCGTKAPYVVSDGPRYCNEDCQAKDRRKP